MTQEQKELLLKDLCARLPYGVKAHIEHDTFYDEIEPYDGTVNTNTINDLLHNEKLEVRPYLRPMGSMTEEEKNELRNLLWFGYPSDDYDNYSHRGIEVRQCLYDDERYSTYDFDDLEHFKTFS